MYMKYIHLGAGNHFSIYTVLVRKVCIPQTDQLPIRKLAIGIAIGLGIEKIVTHYDNIL